MFSDLVTSVEELRGIIGGEPSELARRKELSALDVHARAFIARSPFLLLGTCAADGRCDVSPKGDAPGFVRVLDDHHLAIPDRPGNKRLDGMRNILSNPHVGLIFLVPGNDFTLRVNGHAVISREPELLQTFEVQGKTPLLAIGVEVEEVFLHCARSFRRGRLWDRATWPGPDALPSMPCILYDQTRGAMSLEALEARNAESLVRLY
ncbi:MAG TPA: pyridoxamine 5'-phosphate oxidase family protein [Candidatus Methylomirabilis sp.]|nr:pyridoxamine 5'-phosphate oxidase family protein [Candidatus Methylomirabilis sp.]